MQSPALVLGFHGCDQSVGEAILNGDRAIEISTNEYDWLGTGAYFWENDPGRAMQWAEFVRDHPQNFKHRVKTPFVLGAVIVLGECLDLFDSACLSEIRSTYDVLEETWVREPAVVRPENSKAHPADNDFVKRGLDCYVINSVHNLGKSVYDTVRGGFSEGEPLFAGSFIMAKTHVQICVRNPAKSIRGYFRLPGHALLA